MAAAKIQTMTHPPATEIGRRTRSNLSVAELYEDAIRAGEGMLAAAGPLVVRTGKHTGRSPEDKFIVDEPSSHDKVWWGTVNRPISEGNYDTLRARLVDYLANRDLYAQDCYIGAHPAHRRSLRVYTETAWASIFARNLFRRPSAGDLATFQPNFTIINVPSFKADPTTEGTRSETAILVHLRRMEIIIVGTEYAGEIKKAAFTVMNYLMPDEGVLPMHSAVNVGRDRDSVVFFGLSGTGKTTLSADPGRLPARIHRQCRSDRYGRPATACRAPDCRRVRRHAADLAPDPRSGRLPFHQRLHGQAGRHRDRGDGAEGAILDLLRGAVHAAPPRRIRRHAHRAARSLGRARLA